MHYQPLTPQDKEEMLQEIGVSSFDELLKGIPPSLREPAMNLPEALSELEIQKLLGDLGAKNHSTKSHLSFLGAGSYEHFIPAAVAQLIGRQEFYTAYTPYQPEASQGTLQAIYEYQSLIAELTGMDVSNASHYDGATAMAEAALVALRHTERSKVLIARSVHPHYRSVLKTYLEGTPYSMEEFGFHSNGSFDRKELSSLLSTDVASVILQSPNFFGDLENFDSLAEELHQAGVLFTLVGYPLSYALFKSPGEWGADIAVGEGQPLGIPLQFGGPYLGYFAVTRALMRRIPGRLAGLTLDSEGRRAFCLTLQAREQHIRRERAASNICTNQALCALAACVYMTLLGKEGIREVAEINFDRAHYLREKISTLKGFTVDLETPIFNEFPIKTDKNLDEIEAKMAQDKIIPGLRLSRFYAEKKKEILICATETKSKEDLDRFVERLSQC
ncbi:MAG: aminomethyl-transferring glycine dehydrogenase subunit GcvPA [Candidatus Omnitrophica bacterium]|nr:aminomethyl-transferring glycine dehydrogenase subunit GcvPA [Candidatus Omnitrophota bacterium]